MVDNLADHTNYSGNWLCAIRLEILVVDQQFSINQKSARSRKARIAAVLSHAPIRFILLLTFIVSIFIVTASAIIDEPLGYLFLGLVGWSIVPIIWNFGELKKLATTKDPTLDAVLEWRILAELDSDKPNITEVWRAIHGHNQMVFFANRFGLHPSFFDQVVPTAQVDMDKLWQKAMQYKSENNFEVMNAACIMVALLQQLPSHQDLLNQLKLDIEEVERGIGWVGYIKRTLWWYRTRKKGGGLARDWSAGYAPLLNRIGRNISLEVEGGYLHRPIDSHEQVLDQMLRVLNQTGRTNIALVGETGVGKTAAVYALAQLLTEGASSQLKFHQVFALNAATILASAHGRGEVEDLVMRIVGEAHHAKNIIIFFDEAQLFLEDGTGSVDLSNVLIPILERANVRFIFALTPGYWQKLSRQNSAFAGLVNYQFIPPAGKEDTFQVMEDQMLILENQHKVVVSYFAMREAYFLADHYISEEAFPGKAIKLLEQAAVLAGPGSLLTAEHVQKTIEGSKGVRVQSVNQDESQKLLSLEDDIHKQMINQSRAVKVVANALRRARSGVRNQDRPIGTFMFLGPTGVGKTQLAKALADVYFGGRDQIIRLDMNEFVNDFDVPRLLAAESANSTGKTFLNQIRAQPFSVVLLDEIEKAHPNVVNIFLQLLDEGRISDTDGREASFKDSIIIATSNAGAERLRQYLDAGYELEQFEEQFVNEVIEMGIFKPEFLNRFDEMVIFRSLKPEELMQVVTLMINDVNKNLATQKVSLQIDDQAKQWLVQRGNDPRLGARPMRRMVQRYVEDIVARKMLEGSAQSGSVIVLTVADFESVS